MAFDYVLPINTTFASVNGALTWDNAAFTNRTAQFYKVPAALLNNAQVLVKFLGSMEPQRGWAPIVLNAAPGKYY